MKGLQVLDLAQRILGSLWHQYCRLVHTYWARFQFLIAKTEIDKPNQLAVKSRPMNTISHMIALESCIPSTRTIREPYTLQPAMAADYWDTDSKCSWEKLRIALWKNHIDLHMFWEQRRNRLQVNLTTVSKLSKHTAVLSSSRFVKEKTFEPSCHSTCYSNICNRASCKMGNAQPGSMTKNLSAFNPNTAMQQRNTEIATACLGNLPITMNPSSTQVIKLSPGFTEWYPITT